MTTPKTVKAGTTADDRVVLSGVHGDVPTSDPAVTDVGWATQGAEFVHAYLGLTGITALDVTPWWFSKITGLWHEGTQINFTTTLQHAKIDCRGEDRVFLVADAVTGTGSFKLWVGYTYDGKDN